MRVLAIETSCDETAIAVVDAIGDAHSSTFSILGNTVNSQIDLHRPYGGVFPTLAKREHAANLVPVLAETLTQAHLASPATEPHTLEQAHELKTLLEREPGLGEALIAYLSETQKPDIDVIAVTHGPGLSPALWVGINFAKALSLAWNIPLVGINHMEGHILSALATKQDQTLRIQNTELPVLALLISGGHTELMLMKEWLSYELVGQTKDDAVGEAFDKVARMLELPYPGGPEISKLAEVSRQTRTESPFTLPRPMLASGTCDFSFAGLKTAVLYILKGKPNLADHEKERLAQEFEDAVAEVLWVKTSKALHDTNAKTLVIGGGVSANTHIRRVFTQKIAEEHPDVSLRIPTPELTTDNALMIALAGFHRAQNNEYIERETLSADGNLDLANSH